jgi:hypothetical protein
MSDEIEIPFQDIVEGYREVLHIKRPKSYGELIEFPESVDGISDQELGNMMLRLTAYRGYGMYLLSTIDVKYAGLKSIYNDELRKTIREQKMETAKRTQTAVENDAINNSPRLQQMVELVERVKAERDLLDRLVGIYEVQVNALSREVTRRGMEIGKNL